VLHLLIREAAREGYNCSFGGSVVEKVGSSNIVVDGCTSDDRVATLHLWKNIFGEEEEWMDVGIESFDPLFPI